MTETKTSAKAAELSDERLQQIADRLNSNEKNPFDAWEGWGIAGELFAELVDLRSAISSEAGLDAELGKKLAEIEERSKPLPGSPLKYQSEIDRLWLTQQLRAAIAKLQTAWEHHIPVLQEREKLLRAENVRLTAELNTLINYSHENRTFIETYRKTKAAALSAQPKEQP